MCDHAERTRKTASFSHGIRAHLNVLLNAVSAMKSETMADGPIREHAATIHSHVLAILRMVNHMQLEDSAGDEDFAALVDAQIDGLLVGIAKAVSPYAQSRHIEFLWDVQSPLFVRCDPDMLARVLYNLLSNAVKFTGPGGHVCLSAREHEAFIRIHVADTGHGLGDSELGRLGSETPASVLGGRGLQIAQKLIAAMNSQLSVTSERNVGTTFYIRLPPAATAAPAATENKAIELEELSVFSGGALPG